MRRSRHSLVTRSVRAQLTSVLPALRAHTRHARVPTSCARVTVASRSPTPTTGGSTPSGRAQPDHQSGHQLFDNCRSIVTPGSRHAAPGRYTRASRLTGRAPGSYPGTDWVRDPGRAPRRRSSTGWSVGPSSRRVRVRVPSVAPCRRGPTDKAPDYESGGCRFDSCRRHHLAVAQRSRAPPSEGGGRTFESCRRGPASDNDQALVAQEAERVPGTDEVVGANPTEGPTEGIRPDEEPVCYAGTGRQPVWVRVPPLPPWKRSGWIRSLSRKQVGVARPLGVRVAPLPHSPRWSRGQDTGPSTRRPGFDSPSRYSHTSTQMPEETKRSRARRAGRRSGVDSAR